MIGDILWCVALGAVCLLGVALAVLVYRFIVDAWAGIAIVAVAMVLGAWCVGRG
jgi:VIT1/CCC1 family predicted Fe2+/Mn2+ transporter